MPKYNLYQKQLKMKERNFKNDEGGPINDYRLKRVESLVFSNEELISYSGPIVYIFWGQDSVGKKKAFYIGKSYHGLARPFAPDHKFIKSNTSCPKELEVFSCKDEVDADYLEKKFIRYYEPLYNIRRDMM